MGSIGFEEMVLILVVAILVYGKELPKVARKVGRWYSNLKRQMSDIKDEISRQIPDEDDFMAPPGESPPDPPGHAPPPLGSTPSADLPGPDAGDPEYRPPFEPAKPPEPAPENK